MRILVRDVATKPEWVAKLSLFLHDADAPEFSYDEATLTFSVSLYRIGHELRRQRIKLWFLKTWIMPRVPCLLSIAPVRVTRIDLGDEQWRDMDELAWFDVDPDGSIEVIARERSARLQAVGPVSILLTDTGEPDEKFRVTDVGAPLLPDALVSEVITTSEA